MHFWQGLNGWMGRSKRSRRAETSVQGSENRRARRRRRSLAEPQHPFVVRRLEDRQVLNADAAAAQTFVVAENAAADTTVGTVEAPQPFDPNQALTYSIVAGNPSNAFLVVPNSGEVQLKNPEAIDYEQNDRWELTIGVAKEGETEPSSMFNIVVQVTDVYAPATVHLTGGQATLSVVDGRLQVQQGDTTLWTSPAEDVSSLTIIGSSEADNLLVNFAGGNPIPVGGLYYDGMDQPVGGLDAVDVRGSFDETELRYDNAHDGGIVLHLGGVERTIEYRNLEPVAVSGSGNVTITLTAMNDDVILEEVSPGLLRISSTTPTIETTTFAAPTGTLTINGGDGDDTVTIRTLSGSYSVVVNGEGGTNNKLIVDQVDTALTSPKFEFAGFAFDQSDTPNQATVLGSGVISGGYGAVINTSPDAATGNLAFPELSGGFDSTLSVGRLIYPALTSGTLALNMPAGNVGTSLRAGIELSWSGGRTLSNQTGDDFVIYESSSNANGPDAAMVQVHITGGGWTKWRYETKDTRANYIGDATQGAFATAYDLSDFGLASGQTIDGIRYANMTGADRMEGPGVEKVTGSGVFVASGFVLPGDNGATSNVLPDPGSSASFAYFGNSTFDPDPLYFGMLHPLAAPTTTGGIDVVSVSNTSVTVTRDGTVRPTINYSSVATLNVNTYDAADQITVALGGAGLPTSIQLNGGAPSVSDKVTVLGTTGTHTIALAGNTITSGPTTISLANIEAATIDVSAGAAGTGDIVTVNRSFTLAGNSPNLQIVGGGSTQNDALSVDTEYNAVAVAAQTYTFAGKSFDQSGTPNQLSELGIGTLSGGLGVVITTRPGDSSALASGFPDSTVGYNPSLSLGALWDRATSTTTRILGMPDSTNNGSSARGGFVVSWSGDRALVDAAGEDFVLYESGTTGSPEPVMVQVHNANTNSWSSWIYKAALAPATTVSGSVGFPTVYDLDADFGMAGATIDAIRVVNMTAADRMLNASGEGVVLPGETNPTSTTLPKPGPNASFANYGLGDFDPDPIYLGVRHALGGVTARNDVVSIDSDSVDITGYMGVNYAGMKALSLNTGDGADSIRVAPSTTTTYAVDGGSPTIATNPGDRVVLDLTGVSAALLTVDGIGAATLSSSHQSVTFTGIDSYGATLTFDVQASSAANPAAGADTYSLVRNGAADELTVNGQLVFRADRSAIDNLEIDGSSDDDTLTINFAGGDPIPAGNVNFVGDVGANKLVYNGTGITTITHRFDSSTAGRTTIDGSIVDYTGTQQIADDLTAANRNLAYTDNGNNIILVDDAAAGDNRSQATSNNGATLTFKSPTSTLTVDAGPQNDSITLERLDSSFDAATTLRGQTGDDFILFDSNGAAAGGTVDWITFALTVDGGGQADDLLTIEDSSSTRNKTYSVSNVQIGGGEIPAGAAVDTPDASPNVNGTADANEWDQVPYAFDTGPRPAANQQSILHFDFSEGSGTTTADTTGNGNNGLLVSTVGPQFRSADGKFGGALEFNGTTDYAWFQNGDFNIGTQGSLSFWVNMDNVSRRNQFFEGPGNLGFEFQFRENSGGQFYGSPNRGIVGNTDDFAISSGGGASLVNTWVNLQYTWQKTGVSTGEMHLYVNGSEVTYAAGSDSNITNWTTVANTAQAFMTMGRDASTTPGSGNSRYFDGKMDDVAFFDVVLNSTQRASIYQSGPTPVVHSIGEIQATGGHDQVFDAKATNPSSGHLVAYWNMDNTAGTSVASGNGGTTVALNVTAEGTQAQYLATGGKFGGALDFTNANSYATFQDPSFDISAEGSLSLWLNMRDGSRRNELFEGPGDSGFEFQYRETTNGQFYGYVDRATGNTDDPAIMSGSARNNVGAWHNLIYTWKRTTATAGELHIYIDGAEVTYTSNNATITGWNNLVSTVNGLISMGRDQGATTPDRWLDGKVDDVAWFNQVLTPTQRAALQTSSVSGIQGTGGHDQYFDAKATNTANGHLLAYWNFDQAPVAGAFAGNGGTPIALTLNVPAGAEGVAFDTVNGPTLPGTGTKINAGVFDGNLDFIRATDSTSLDFSKQQGSISFWINPSTHAVDNTSAGFSNLVEDANEQIEVGISWQDNAGAAFGNADFYRRIVFSPFENTASGNQNIVVSNTRLAFNQWTHVTVTWDFTTRTAAIYINGQLDSTLMNNTSNASIWTQAAGNTGDWIFGADGKAASRFFTGKMADIAVFGSALRASEVQSTYLNGAGNSGGFDLAGAKGRFTWDSTTLYGLIEDYPAGAANSNGPFSNLLVDVYYNGNLVASLDASQPSNNVPGSVVASGGGGARYEFSIPFASISPTFNPANGDSLTYKVRTIDADVPGAGFDTKETTLGWVVEPPLASNGYRQLDFATSENFFGVGGRLTYANVANLTLNAGNGVDTIRVVDSALPTPVTNPTRSFTINAGGGNDDVTIASIDAAFKAAITIDGQAGGDDHVAIDAALELGSTVSTGNLLVTAERIDVTKSIKTSAGTVGNVTFHAATKLTMTDPGSLTDDFIVGGNFLADGGAVDTEVEITTDGGTITFAAPTTLTGDVTLTSNDGNIQFQGTTTTLDGTFKLTIDAGAGDVGFDGVVGGSNALDDVVIDAAKDVSFDKALSAKSLTHLNGTGVTTFDGLTTFGTAAGDTALDLNTLTVVVNDEVQSTGGDFNIATDNLTINTATGSLDVTSVGIVTIVPQTTTRTISLGSNVGTSLSLTDLELDLITADVLRVGDATSGSIDVALDIDPAAVPILHLTTGGNVGGSGNIEISQLAVEAAGNVQLTPLNDVDRLAVRVMGTNSHIAFQDADDVLLTEVDGVRGLTTVNGNATLQTGGAVTQDAVAASSKIAVNGLELLGIGPMTLTNATNVVNTLAASLTGPLTFRDAADLTVGAVQTFGPATSGVTTTDDDVNLRSLGTVTLESSVAVGNAAVRLTSDNEAIVQSGAVTTKVTAVDLGLSAATGIGVGQPLIVDVDQLAAQNFISGNITIVEPSGTLLTIGTAAGVTGITNLGGGATSVQHVGPMTVASPIVDAAGGITLSTTADGGDDDHLSLNAPIVVLGGAGSMNLSAGTDLLVHDTGVANDVWVIGSGSLFGNAGRNVILDSNVIVRSATGAIENIPPQLQNLSGPQVTNLGEAEVTYDFGRALELHFTALVDWSDGTVDVYSFFNPGTTTAAHIYDGNPNTLDQAAPILVSVTLISDSRIHFAGYETTTLTTLLEFPGDGVKHVRIDTTPHVPHVSIQPPLKFVEIQQTPQTQIIRAIIDGGGSSTEETVETTKRIVVLREILPDGREGSEVQFEVGALEDLAALFKRVRNGKYKVILVEPESKTERTVIEINVQDGKPTSAEAGTESMRDRPDGANWRLDDATSEMLAAEELSVPSDDVATEGRVPVWVPATVGAAMVVSTGNWSSRAHRALATYKKTSRVFSKYRPRRRSR